MESLSPKSPKLIPIPIPFQPSTALLKPSPSSYGFATREPYTMAPNKVSGIIPLFTAKPGTDPAYDLTKRVAFLMNELVREASNSDRVRAILDEKFYDLIMWSQQQQHPAGSASLELLKQLDSWPALAMQVFNWRRRNSSVDNTITIYEYSKGIKAAGRSRNVDLATELFKEAANRGIVSTSIYNALMGAFMFNGLAERCRSLFCEMKRDATCTPTIATYNILISVFGRLMLIDHMEATFKEINEHNPLFTAKPGTDPAHDLTKRVSFLMNELVREASDSDRVRAILDEKFYDLIMWSQQQQHPAGSASLELLKQLDSWPALAMQKEESPGNEAIQDYRSKIGDELPDIFDRSKTQIGDETLIIAALMAMRHPKSIVLSGALSALIIMTDAF
ncbi:hypothetical protein RIF29_13925 [Crotalaria pallida]|uniref:Pentatricopeptide repeat protein n=1 Tax=Crotalaria pallida TaxID=3830 RepID=A0AAN9FJ53_CROPI